MSSSANGTRSDLFVARSPVAANGNPRIRRLLIANRGEIACRIIATCQTLGVASIAVFTDEDRDSLHVHTADEAICLGSIDQEQGNPHQNAKLLIQTALSANADAIHPGYGYLSENADFARAVQEAHLLFVGPSPNAISILGDKRQAKDFLQRTTPQVPLIPGYTGTTQDVQELENQAAKIGYPILIKAAAGGGGRGLRVVHSKEALQGELSRAQSEAQRSFGSSDCMLEKFIERGKHIEIQIVGDSSGDVISLFDRECSVQRRFQKIIEEAPSPWLSEALRNKMVEAAKAIGRSMQYENAGTVEFIVDIDTASFYFLEVNTRIQVEHAITEETTGVDIVALQLFVAAGGLLANCNPLANVFQFGHSIECRICAEDPTRDFIPDSGLILRWTAGSDLLEARQIAGVRIETAIRTASRVSPYFDSMIAKVIVRAGDRPSAINKMIHVLRNTICVGIKTNLLFLQACLAHPEFRRVDYSTNFIMENIKDLLQNPYNPNIPAALETYSFVPALFVRWIANRAPDPSAYRPFRSLAPGFRNQAFDHSNTAADVITNDSTNSSQNESLNLLLTWRRKRGTAEDTFFYQSRPVSLPTKEDTGEGKDTKDSKSGIDLIRHYNEAFMSHYQTPQADLPEHTVRIVRYEVQEQASVSQKWLTCDMIVDSDGKKTRLHLTTDSNYNARGAGAPQRMFCHTPDLGTSMVFLRYTPLAYGESLRAQFGISTAVDELRMYKSFMPCKILRVLKKKGESVKKGETMLVVESMKTEMKTIAGIDGTFEPKVAEGDAIDAGVPLCEIL